MSIDSFNNYSFSTLLFYFFARLYVNLTSNYYLLINESIETIAAITEIKTDNRVVNLSPS